MTLPAAVERERLFDAIAALVAIGTVKPTLLFVDDAHRMGQAASEILMRLALSLKILVSYRPEEISSDHPIHTHFRNQKTGLALLQLEPLTPNDVATLIEQLAQNNLAEVGEEIIKQTSGHPLYLVTLLQHMFDEGQLYVDEGGRWGAVHHHTPTLPPTIRETIEARLMSFDRSQKRILDLAAVMGGEFDFDLLREASQQAEETLLTTLDRLIDLALIIEPRRSGQSEFAISHDRYIEVAYDTLPAVRRKYLHLQVANAIESKYIDHLMAYYPALAVHFGKAEVFHLERHYATLAGEQAAAQFENTAAVHYLSRALELIEPAEINERLRLLLAREKVYDLLGERQNQKSDLDELNTLIDKLPLFQQAEIIWRKAAFEWVTGEVDSASILLDKAIELAKSGGAIEIETASLLLKSRCVTYDYGLSHEYLEAALALAQENGLRVIQGDIVRNLGNIYFWENNYVQSQANFEEALIIHREIGDLRGELSALNNLGHLSQLIGNPKSAREFFQQGLEICTKIGDRLAEGVLLGNLGSMLVALGDYNQAEIHLKKAIEIREEIKNDEGVGSLLPILGDSLRRQGKYSEAKIHLDQSLEINTRIEHPQQQCLSLDGLSQLYRDLGDYETAFAFFERALAALDDEQSPNRVRALANGCLLLHLRGDDLAALEIGEKALALSQELPLTQAIAFKNLGHVLTALEKFDVAQEKYLQALDLHQELIEIHLQPEPLAGLAQVALKMGANHQALSYVEEILPSLEKAPLIGPDQPGLIYLTCYQVLSARQDQRAGEIWKFANNLLQKRAAALDDELLRQAYLENVSTHREIIRLVQTKQ